MVGLDGELIEILDRLSGYKSSLEIIPIVGMGGIGKTTLAKNAYQHPLIVQYFHVHVWVTVSHDYRPREILQGIVRSIGASNEERFEERDESLRQMVYKGLKGRRYLIVMDDVWTANAWDDVKRIFPDDKNGSRIVITTRLADVALYVNSSATFYKMKFMNEDHSWSLLQKVVFGHENCPLELEEIGKIIAIKCQGLPDAISLIGKLLSEVDPTRQAWKVIAKNARRTVNADHSKPENSLSLGFDQLPHHLRLCFLYLGAFPENYEIHVSNLIQLWIAEGFLKPHGSKTLEEIAEEYLVDLVGRNLVLVVRKSSNGKIKTVKIHDHLRDPCLMKAQDEKFLYRVDRNHDFPQTIENPRRLSIFPDTLGHFSNINLSSVRTFLHFNKNKDFLICLKDSILLRVLDAQGVYFKEFPLELVGLFHLRYLAFTYRGSFSFTDSLKIPSSVSKLQNLQTLIVRPGMSIDEFNGTIQLPFEVWKMPQLRHLILFQRTFLPDPSTRNTEDAFVLVNLQTLSYVANFKCTRRITELIPNLKKLGLYYFCETFKTQEWSEHSLHNLVNFNQLEKLNLKVDRSFGSRQPLSKELVAFPLNLKKLTLTGSMLLRWEDMTIIGSMPNLEVLKLRDYACVGNEWETNEGEFLNLKVLLIDTTELSSWIVESFIHFPSLEQLMLYRCYKLDEIPRDIGVIWTLQLIQLDGSNKSLVNSATMIQKEQKADGNDLLEVRIGKS